MGPQLQELADKRNIFRWVPDVSVILGEIYGVCEDFERLLVLIGLFPFLSYPQDYNFLEENILLLYL